MTAAAADHTADNLRELTAQVSFCSHCLQVLMVMIQAAQPGTMLPADKLGALLGPVAEQLDQAEHTTGMLMDALAAEPEGAPA